MFCREFEELSGAYVLNAITPIERREAEAHLALCPECRELLQELQQVVDLLPLVVAVPELPPRLKGRVLSSISAQKAKPQPRRFKRYGWRPLLVAAALLMFCIMLGGLIAWNITLQQRMAFFSAGETISYVVASTETGNEASGLLTYLPQQNMSVLMIRGLPRPPGKQVYQGWLCQGAQVSSMGLLDVQNKIVTGNFPGDITHYEMILISLEPGPDASRGAPQGKIVAAGLLNKVGMIKLYASFAMQRNHI
jgi:anti-sigma-K factor RskA